MTARVLHSSTLRPPEGRRRKSSGLLGQSSGEHSVDKSHRSDYRRRRSGSRRGRSQSAPRTRRESSQERSCSRSDDRRQSNSSMEMIAVQRDHHARLKSISSRRHYRNNSGAYSVCSLPAPKAPGSVCSRQNPPPPPPRKSKSSIVPPPPPVVVMKAVREDDGTESTSPSTDPGTDPGSELPRRARSYQPESYASNLSQAPPRSGRGRSASVSRVSASVGASGRSGSVARRRASSRGRVRSRSVGRARSGQAVKREDLLTFDGSAREGSRNRTKRRSKMEGTGRSLSRSRWLASRRVRGGEASALDESTRSARSARSARSTRSHARSESRSRRYRQTYGDSEYSEAVRPQRSFDQMDESAAGSRRSKSTSRSMSRSRRMRGGARRSPSPEVGSRGPRRISPRRSRSHSRSGFRDRSMDRSPEPSQDCQEYQEHKAHPQDCERMRGPQEDVLFDQGEDTLVPDNGPGNEINLVIDSQGRGRFHIAARSPMTNDPLNCNTHSGATLIPDGDNHSGKRQQYLTFDIQLDEPSRRYLIHASMGRLDVIRAIHPGMNILRTLSYWNNLQKKRYGVANGAADTTIGTGEGGRLGIVSRNRTNVVLMTLMGEYSHRAWERDKTFQRELERFVEDALQFHACLNGGDGESATLTSGEDGAPEAGDGSGLPPMERRVSTNGESGARDASSDRSKKGGGGRGKLLGKVFPRR